MFLSAEVIIHHIGVFGVGVFAISGALAAAEKKLDIFAFILLGVVTGVGGGTVRDVLLNVDYVFWVEDSLYLTVCIGAAIITYFMANSFASLEKMLLWMDAAGLGLFCVLGCAKSWALTHDPVISVSMGVATATFGSVIRDVLLNNKLVMFGPELYVTCAVVGSLTFIILTTLNIAPLIIILVASLTTFLLRVAAISFDLRLPKYGKQNC